MPEAAAATAPVTAPNATPPNGAPKGVQTAATGKDAAPPPPKPKLVIKGQEYDEDWAHTHIEKGKGAEKLLTEADKRAKAWERERKEFEALYEKDPVQAIEKRLGKAKAREYFEKYVYDRLQEDNVSEDAKRAMKAEQELLEERAKREQYEKEQKEQKTKAETQHWRQQFEQKIIKALESEKVTSLMRNEGMVKRVAHRLEQYKRVGIDLSQVPAELLGKEVLDEVRGEHQALVGGMSGDELIDFLGPEKMAALRKADIARWRGKQKGPVPGYRPPREDAPATASQPKRTIGIHEFRKLLDNEE